MASKSVSTFAAFYCGHEKMQSKWAEHFIGAIFLVISMEPRNSPRHVACKCLELSLQHAECDYHLIHSENVALGDVAWDFRGDEGFFVIKWK